MTATADLSTFTLVGTPRLASGQSMALLARTPRLWLHAKLYAEGGENALHCHPQEDHLFFVLEGEAIFTDATDAHHTVGALDGVLVPRGVSYCFRSTGESNLVMLRVGADASDEVVAATLETEPVPEGSFPAAQAVRAYPDGRPFPPTDPQNRDGAVLGVAVPGRTVGEPDAAG